MKIFQWVYTTSCWNIRGTRGWDTFSYTEGLSKEEVDELEMRCQVPDGLPEEFFPLHFVLTLESGKQAVCRTSYLGNSFYDGRRGATLTHALIIDENSSWPGSPAAFFDSELFWRDLPEELKEQALAHKETRDTSSLPDYLPEIPESDLLATPGYSFCDLQRKLCDPLCATHASKLVEKFLTLEEEDFPFTYSCDKADELSPMLAMLHALLPWALKGKNTASLFRTTGNAIASKKLTVAGSRDTNVNVDLNGSDAVCAPHHLVEIARENLDAWYAYASEWDKPAADSIGKLCNLFPLLQTKSGRKFSEERLRPFLQLREEELRPELWKKVAFAVASGNWQVLPPELFTRFADTMLRRTAYIAPCCTKEEKYSWSAILRELLHQLATHAGEGNISVDTTCELCSIDSLFSRVWLSEAALAAALKEQQGSEGSVSLLIISQKLADTLGDKAPGWMQYECVTNSLRDIAFKPTYWSKLVQALPEAVSRQLWVLQRHSFPEQNITLLPEFLDYAKSRSAESRQELRRYLIENQQEELAAAEFLSGIIDSKSYSTLMAADPLLSKSLSFANEVLPSALEELAGTPYSLEEGRWLLALLGRVEDEELRNLLKSCLSEGFPLKNKPSPEVITLAQRILRHCLKQDAASCDTAPLELLCNLPELEATSPKDTAEYLKRCFLPLFEPSSDRRMKQDARKAIAPWFLHLVLNIARTPEVHFCLLQHDWGWANSDTREAYSQWAKYLAATGKAQLALEQGALSLFETMVQIEDEDALRHLLDSCEPLFALFTGKKELSTLQSRLAALPNKKGYLSNWDVVEKRILKHRKGVIGTIVSLFTKS